MSNVWTLTIFENGQPQALVLQYKGRDNARRDRDLMLAATPEKVTVIDDYGRELTFRPMNVQTTILQDVDKAVEGNTLANVKNAIANELSQVRAHKEADDVPEIKQFKTQMRFAQGGAIRA